MIKTSTVKIFCCEFETVIQKWGEGLISSLLKICIFLFLCSRFQDMECESNTWRLGISSYVTLWDKILEKIQQVIYGQKVENEEITSFHMLLVGNVKLTFGNFITSKDEQSSSPDQPNQAIWSARKAVKLDDCLSQNIWIFHFSRFLRREIEYLKYPDPA